MKKILSLSFSVFLWISCSSAFSWNANGHIVISQLAYEQLTPSTQKKVDQLSATLFKQLPFSTQYDLNQKYPHVSEFAKLSVLPDHFRKQPLHTIFEQYQGKLPDALQSVAEKNTSHWHFIDKTYPSSPCPNLHSADDTLWAIRTLKPIVKNETDPISQGLALALLTHFIEDIHQPLHTFSYAKAGCKTDKGGNSFCLSPKKEGRRCKHNLHHLWDTSVGFLRGRQPNLTRKMNLLTAEFPAAQFQKEIQETNPAEWANENYSYASFIYSIKPDRRPYAQYYKKGQHIAKQQLAIASYRLAYTLNYLLGSNTP